MQSMTTANNLDDPPQDPDPLRIVHVDHTHTEGLVHVSWSDHYTAEFDAVWLRHNAPGARLASGQSLINPAELPANLLVSSIAIGEADQALIHWNDDAEPVTFSGTWLRRHAEIEETEDVIELWHEPLGDRLPRAVYASWDESDAVLLDWLKGFQRFGVALLQGVPADEQAIEQVAERFGLILETNYGRVFSVKARAEPENLADSAFGLPLHTDNPYRNPTPGAQVLHCLCADNGGGESLFADGFAAAQRLAGQDPDAYAILTHTPVRFHYETADTLLETQAPMSELDSSGIIRALRFNSRSMMPDAQPARDAADFYAAYRALHETLHAPESLQRIKLEPGDLVLMDNRRLLHGRSAITQGGDRHLRGCYMQADSIHSRLAILKRDAVTEKRQQQGAIH